MFGVDRHMLGGIKISTVDLEKILANEKIKIYKDGETIVLKDSKTQEELIFSTLVINDNEYFKSLVIGCKMNEGFKVEYVHLDVFISEPNGCNLVPLNMEQLMDKHERLKDYIFDEYGILIKYEDSYYNFLELNNTVELDHDSLEYQKVLKLMSIIAPKRYKSRNLWTDENNEVRGVFLENNSMKIKIYNKSKQLLEEYNITLAKTYLRVEIVLKDSRKIKEVFGTTSVKEITEEKMKEYYLKVINADIFEKIEKYIKSSNRELKKLAKEEQEKDMRKWTRSFLLRACGNELDRDLELVFDIEQCLEIIKKKTGKNYKRTLKRLENDINEKEHKKNNLDRYAEIKSKLFELN